MAAPFNSYVYMVPIQQQLWDKDLNVPLAGGIVTFFSDSGLTVPKNVYVQNGSGGFIPVGSTLTLSIIGTFINPNDGTNAIPFLWPYVGDPSSHTGPLPAQELYFIRVQNSDGVEQFTVGYWPPINTAAGGGSSTGTVPTVQVLTSSSGTYSLPVNPSPLYIQVEMVGGGGGGGGSGNESAAGGNGGAGGSTTFGTALLSCTGGGGGLYGGGPNGAPGTATIGGAARGSAYTGSYGGGASNIKILAANGNAFLAGGIGGCSPFGGAGGGSYNATGLAAATNSGSGGGGGGQFQSATLQTWNGGGGSSGGYLNAIIPSPAATYSYTVGAAGTAGTAGGAGSGYAGGAGAAGRIVVTEYYQ